MRLVIFCHSLISDWNHGNAHFLRGIAVEWLGRGFELKVYEPAGGWSFRNMLAEKGAVAVRAFREAFPLLNPFQYSRETLDLDEALDGADLVLVHEWNEPWLIREIGARRKTSSRFRLLFHDTHHRMASDPGSMSVYDLSGYDGVLAFGNVIRQAYLDRGLANRAWTWHEAADCRLFHPCPAVEKTGELVWIGNWGDGERSEELRQYLVEPARDLKLTARIHGVRYPEAARATLVEAGIRYEGWLPNHRAPAVFAAHLFTVHVPRRPYVNALPGIPTIRVFEALACGIPLISTFWEDREKLFEEGRDFLMARTPEEMRCHMRALREDRELRDDLAWHGLETIRARHTCAHRVDELLAVARELGIRAARSPGRADKSRTPQKENTLLRL
jgi:spore maturation protein CgeB